MILLLMEKLLLQFNVNILYDNVHYQEVVDMLEDGRANIEFLGVSSSLITLKSDLVFMMVIKDKDFYVRNRHVFKSNYGAKSLSMLPIEKFFEKDFIENKCLCQELAGPLELLKKSKTFRKLMEE